MRPWGTILGVLSYNQVREVVLVYNGETDSISNILVTYSFYLLHFCLHEREISPKWKYKSPCLIAQCPVNPNLTVNVTWATLMHTKHIIVVSIGQTCIVNLSTLLAAITWTNIIVSPSLALFVAHMLTSSFYLKHALPWLLPQVQLMVSPKKSGVIGCKQTVTYEANAILSTD